MDDVNIMEICGRIISETNGIIEYSTGITNVTDETLRGMLQEIRNDKLGHLQRNIVALTEILSVYESGQATSDDDSSDKKKLGEDE